jgi:hypothetical protein
MKTEIIKLDWEEVKELIPDKVSLYYVDYRDSLDEYTDILQKCISNQNKEYLYEKVDDWFVDGADIEHYITELKGDIEQKYDINNADYILDEFEDQIRDTLYDRDDSDVLKDLMRNTSKIIMFYDTGYEMESESWSWTMSAVKKERQKIKKHLGIPAKQDTWDDQFDLMIRQASYGGTLEIYFRDNIEDYLEIEKDCTKISFTNPTIGIVNHYNGSGDQADFYGLTITLPLNAKNIFIDKEVKYSWTYSIAGMCHDAYDDCKVQFIKGKNKKEIPLSSTNKHMEKETILNETYSKGKCTFGDMDYSRHRNQTYINNYPCGNKCLDCGTFWID